MLYTGCKSVDGVLFQPSPVALSERLPSLEIAVDNGPFNNSQGALPEDAQQLFEREVRMNLTEPEDTARFGFAHLQIVEATAERRGRFWQGLQMLTLMTPTLLGVPVEWYETDLRATVQILNAQGDTLATYRGQGKSRVRVAMYHGYAQTQAHRLADLEALRLALGQIKPQMEMDAARLRRGLLTAGPIGRHVGQVTGSAWPAGTAAPAPAER
ncbi:hypothetical protein GCM10027048_17640 [Hymenobacter coalescens]